MWQLVKRHRKACVFQCEIIRLPEIVFESASCVVSQVVLWLTAVQGLSKSQQDVSSVREQPQQTAHRPSGWGLHPPHAHTCWAKKKEKKKITPRLPLNIKSIKRTVGLGSCYLLTLQPVSALLAPCCPWQPCMCKKKRKEKPAPVLPACDQELPGKKS